MKLLLLCLSCLVAFSHGVDVAKKFKLSSGHEIPSVGLGTSAIEKEKMEKAIASALDNGYRHIDTAFSYENEALIGKALKAYFDKGGKRENLFVTSKLPSQGNRPQSVEKYLKKSLQDLGLSYVDMYLIHTPFAIKEGKNMAPLEKDGSGVFDDIDHIALWKAMEKQVKEGRAKSIGLSNFNATQISKIYNAAEIKPSNLQVESHAYLQQKKLREFCKQKNIVITAYSPLGSSKSRQAFYPKGSPKDLPPLIENPIVVELAKKYKKTPAQILLRHSVQDGLVVIPKSSSSMRQKENIELFNFKLTDEDFKKISALDEGEKGRVFDYLLFYKDLQNNPEYPWGGSSK